MDRDDPVLDLARTAEVLPLHAGGLDALLDRAGLVDDANRPHRIGRHVGDCGPDGPLDSIGQAGVVPQARLKKLLQGSGAPCQPGSRSARPSSAASRKAGRGYTPGSAGWFSGCQRTARTAAKCGKCRSERLDLIRVIRFPPKSWRELYFRHRKCQLRCSVRGAIMEAALRDDIEALRREATLFRAALEQAVFDSEDGSLQRFSTDCCHHACKLFGIYLLEKGYGPSTIVVARRQGKPERQHVWLLHQGVIIDLTGDQFQGEGQPPVVVIHQSRWHDGWERLQTDNA